MIAGQPLGDAILQPKVVVDAKGVAKTFRLPKEHSQELRRHLINLVHGEKGYLTLDVLRDISFSVYQGDFFGIVGRNGSGKSTLLKLLAGIYQPTSGEIYTEGKIVTFIELGVGFNPELSGRENVYLNGAMLGFSNDEVAKMYDDIVDFAELGLFMDQKLKNYSSGMQVRLAFSIAIKAQGDILILDEVLAVGDEAFQRKCNDYFKQIKKDRSKTVILVTHDMGAIKRFCNRAIVIEDGEIIYEGDPIRAALEYSSLFGTVDTATLQKKSTEIVGDVVLENVSYRQTTKALLVDFDVTNRTDRDVSGLGVRFDFYTNGTGAVGNQTSDLDEYHDGIMLHPRETKSLTLTFDNNFGHFDFTLNMSVLDSSGQVLYFKEEVVKFTSTNTTYLKSWNMLTFPVLSERMVEKQ